MSRSAPPRRATSPRFALALLLALAACDAAAGAQDPWRAAIPDRATRTGAFRHPDLTESSGVVVSRTHAGLLWTMNDGGNDATLFATDTLGRALGALPLPFRNTDWEAIAAGPCPGGTCLYLGDVGDNRRRRKDVEIYRFPEPADPRRPGAPAIGPVERIRLRYEDGPQDVEAMLVTPDGDLLLVAKTIAREARYYRVSAAAWGSRGRVKAERMGTLPIDAMSAIGRRVTDAALAPDGERVVVRTYRDLYFFRLRNDRLMPDRPPVRCDVTGLEPQGEGVAWLDARTLVLTSERGMSREAPIHLVRCRGAS